MGLIWGYEHRTRRKKCNCIDIWLFTQWLQCSANSVCQTLYEVCLYQWRQLYRKRSRAKREMQTIDKAKVIKTPRRRIGMLWQKPQMKSIAKLMNYRLHNETIPLGIQRQSNGTTHFVSTSLLELKLFFSFFD